MTKNTVFLRVPSRVGKFFRAITGDYDAARRITGDVWVVERHAIAKARRHSVNHLRKFRGGGRKTVALALGVAAKCS